ncbi:MAG: Fic family protein [Paludibacteraceae bacterium]|nr:Fic family protein [Paludibacteraceae bacterium]
MRAIYLWQHKDWPRFSWDAKRLLNLLGEVRSLQGQLLGRMSALGFEGVQRHLEALTEEIIGSSQIEGVELSRDSVRSSVARHLGVTLDKEHLPDHYTDGVVNVMMEATQRYTEPLSAERLFGWHAALFPTGYSDGYKIDVARWRIGEEPMRVVSGPIGKQKVHYEAPNSEYVPQMMDDFLAWVNNDNDNTDSVIRAALAHLWFVTIHPFDDGNGRITRTITEMMLARADQSERRFYSMSAEIMRNRKGYYDALEQAQKCDMDVTEWLVWFLETLRDALSQAIFTTQQTLAKAAFWQRIDGIAISERQRKIINMLWDGFDGKLNTAKWAKINHCSQDTALRDIDDLIKKGILCKAEEGGRSTNYALIESE